MGLNPPRIIYMEMSVEGGNLEMPHEAGDLLKDYDLKMAFSAVE
jgi:hypothetical protein